MDKLDIIHLQLYLIALVIIKIGYEFNLYDNFYFTGYSITALVILFLSLFTKEKG